MKVLKIGSKDNTDMIIFVEKIQYIHENKNGCSIGLDNGCRINSTANYKDIEKAIDILIKDGEAE